MFPIFPQRPNHPQKERRASQLDDHRMHPHAGGLTFGGTAHDLFRLLTAAVLPHPGAFTPAHPIGFDT